MSAQTEMESDQQMKLRCAYPWINNDLFEEILRVDFPTESIIIQKYYLNAALPYGENYSSQMIRAKVDYTINSASKQISFIIKAAQTCDNLDEKMVNEMKEVFRKEMTVYDKVLTKVRELLKEIDDKTKLHGRCYKTNEDIGYLIFEDLSAVGFCNVDRRTGLDMTHLKLVLSVAAKYHAATVVLVEKEPSLKTFFKDHVTESGESFLRKMLTNVVVAQKEFCKRKPHLEYLVPKLNGIENTFFNRICETTTRNDNDFNVIVHGDLWSNNIMFKYDKNGDVEDTVLVDFQLCYYGSPALDLTYCMYTSSHNDVTESDWDILVQCYSKELRKTLKKLNYSKKVPSLMELNAQIIMKGMYAAGVGPMCEGGRMLENVGADGLANFVIDEAAEYRLNMLLNPKVAPKIEMLIKYFDRRGRINK
ncbi:hypothetical protein Bhyg_06232 [Pseudolycoriella hygida]|uniref:CHK kinase-like domain-containing protein n=1 Tax=Pseudolycoriella hygida TaxID=35572 RepID=A0A9Q0N104_9DIPT|nr:hypothetical protein Bhyg_06232 [Pseudolycoriella hygida]